MREDMPAAVIATAIVLASVILAGTIATGAEETGAPQRIGIREMLAAAAAIFTGEEPGAAQLICIEARFSERGPAEKLGAAAAPRLTTAAGQTAVLRMVEERFFPNGKTPERPGDPADPAIDTVEVGTELEVTPEIVEGGLRLVGRATITDILDVIKTTPPNEALGASYTVRRLVAPFSVIVASGSEFLTIPMASRGDSKAELQLRATLVDRTGQPLNWIGGQ